MSLSNSFYFVNTFLTFFLFFSFLTLQLKIKLFSEFVLNSCVFFSTRFTFYIKVYVNASINCNFFYFFCVFLFAGVVFFKTRFSFYNKEFKNASIYLKKICFFVDFSAKWVDSYFFLRFLEIFDSILLLFPGRMDPYFLFLV